MKTIDKNKEILALDAKQRILELVRKKAPEYLIDFHQNRHYLLIGEYVNLEKKEVKKDGDS